jgi:dTDP-4-dehydrorhamnose reductase
MILILGASGYIGRAYQSFFARQGIDYKVGDRLKLNYLRPEGLRQLVDEVRPEFLINASGYTGKPNVDSCEDHKAECLEANAVFPALVKVVCTETRTPWGHVSSGCIFTGNRPDGSGFQDEDCPNFTFRQNNCSFYSGTKALGEELLHQASQCYIWRLRMPFHYVDNPRNYLTKVISYARLLDVRNSLSQLDDFVRLTSECWSRRLPFGVYNVTNPGAITTREIVEMIKKSALGSRLSAKGKFFSFFADEAEFMRLAAKTPRSNCILDSGKLLRLGVKMPGVHEAVEQALSRWETPL